MAPYISDHSKVGAPTTSKEDSADTNTYDVIIVGGGTAGCALAARLSEDPSIKVLLLEAGGSSKGVLFSQIPAAFSELFYKKKHAFQFYTEPQANLNNGKKFWPRGKMLGGCSAINAQMAQYGAPGDFDEWAKIIKDDQWAWKNFKESFKKFEKYTKNEEYPDVDTALRGSDGPVEVGYHNEIAQSSKDFVKSCMNLEIPFSPDFNVTGGSKGVNRIMTYIDSNRKRVTSESAYLTDVVLARPNLRVTIHASVTKILFETEGDETRAVGVEFAKDAKSKRFRVRAREEVVLCAGAIHTPQILMVSGIGPAEELNKHKIPVVKDLPVGDNLIDHPVVDFYFKDKSKTAPKFFKPKNPWDVVLSVGYAAKYLATKRGPLTSQWAEAAAFIRSDDPTLFPSNEFPKSKAMLDSTSSLDSPDLELFLTTLAYKDHGRTTWNLHTVAIHACLLRPDSRGSITLKSNSPWDAPVIDPKYLDSEHDLERLVKGGRICLKIAQTKPLADRVDLTDKEGLDGKTHLKTNKELENIIKERLETLYHPVGTCRMAPLEDRGVVDSRLHVYGVKGLRVADASIFPNIVSGHTAGACFAVGEKSADILKADLRPSHPQ